MIGGVGLIAVVGLREAAGGEGKKSEATAAAKLVDAIVNRNEPPKLVDRREGWPSRLALFPEGYDWKEDDRVRAALDNLYQDTTVELWEELVRRESDPSYCVTLVSVKNEDAEIQSIGDVCGELAWSRLTVVYKRHLPPARSKDDGSRITLDIGVTDLAKWRKERKDKSLYQLQIEVCEKAIKELSKIERAPEDEKVAAQKKIEAEIENLRRAKQPVLVKYKGYFVAFRQFGYDAELAKKVRKVVKSGSSESFDIVK
jgi:hypothetical protein